jgi:transcriptional regulator with XRE-family HTH domain
LPGGMACLLTTDATRLPGPTAHRYGVRSYRHKMGLSQEAMAYEAGINRTYIASLEAGQRNPSLDLMARLAVALRVEPGDPVKGLPKKWDAVNEFARHQLDPGKNLPWGLCSSSRGRPREQWCCDARGD